MHLIELERITKKYDNLVILENVDFFVDNGFSYAITGRSGAGKSTLLHIMALLDSANEGKIFIKGKEIVDFSDSVLSEFRNKEFGFVFQDNLLIGEYSALENVMLPALIQGVGKSEARDRAVYLLESLSLKDRLKHKPWQLSTGERLRVSICRALINNPSVIFADEPTGSLDEVNALYVEKLLLNIVKKENKTLILVTHNPEFAEKCDFVYRISKGFLLKAR